MNVKQYDYDIQVRELMSITDRAPWDDYGQNVGHISKLEAIQARIDVLRGIQHDYAAEGRRSDARCIGKIMADYMELSRVIRVQGSKYVKWADILATDSLFRRE